MNPDSDWKIAVAVFNVVFLAELGGMSQMATVLYSAESPQARGWVFIGASLAMLLAVAIAVVAGGWVAYHLSPRALHAIAGGTFIVIGLWSLRAALL